MSDFGDQPPTAPPPAPPLSGTPAAPTPPTFGPAAAASPSIDRKSVLYPVLIFGGLLGTCFVFALILISSLNADAKKEPFAWTSGKGPKIGVVEIKGPISDSRTTVEQLIEFRRDKDIKAIVVRIDSPGGAVAPSQEMFLAIKRARQDKKVVVSMSTVAASGGFYIAVAADKVYALPGTITGSIGVISEFPQVDGLMDLLHLKATTIKSGALKDVGSPLRAMTDAEKLYLQGFVNGIFEQFLGDVAEARKLDKNELRKIADGRILTGVEARDAKLVDELGTLEDAINGAAKLAGETGEPVPVFVHPKRGLLRELLHDGAETMSGELRESLHQGASIEARDPRF